MEIEELFELPFTDRHDSGVSGVFPDDDEVIRDLLESVKKNVLVEAA